MEYRYIAYTKTKSTEQGIQTAANIDIAAKILASHGYKVLSLKPVSIFLPKWGNLSLSMGKVKPQTITVFTRQWAMLLDSGIDVIAALKTLHLQITDRRLKLTINDIIGDIRHGERLSEAFAKHPKVFSPIYIQSLKVGEESGNLESMLRKVAEYLEKEAKAAKNVKGALRYPIIVGIVGFIVLLILTFFVLPAFNSLYQSLGVDLPTITRWTMTVISWLAAYGVYVLGFILAGVIALSVYGRTPKGQLKLHKIILKLPLWGRVVHLTELMRCCRSMSILHKVGLPMPEIILMTTSMTGNAAIKQALTQVHQGVIKGESISKTMARSEYFLPMMVQMVSTGEATGNLDVTLEATAQSYETEAEERMQSIIELIQPAIIALLGIFISMIALSLVSAMYSIYGQGF